LKKPFKLPLLNPKTVTNRLIPLDQPAVQAVAAHNATNQQENNSSLNKANDAKPCKSATMINIVYEHSSCPSLATLERIPDIKVDLQASFSKKIAVSMRVTL
jgi:hypothetical protein